MVDLRKISISKYRGMKIPGLDITVDSITSKRDLVRVIIYLSGELVHRSKRFDSLMIDLLKYKDDVDKVRKRLEKLKVTDPELSRLLKAIE